MSEATARVDIDASMDIPLCEVSATAILLDGVPDIQVIPEHRSRWRTALGREIAGKRLLTVSVSRYRVRRSTAANAYLWGVVYRELLTELRIIAQKAGERCPFDSEQQLHEAMKYCHLGVEVVEIGGQRLERPSTTTTLDMEQFSAYVSAIKRMAAERWQIYISEAA